MCNYSKGCLGGVRAVNWQVQYEGRQVYKCVVVCPEE